jgi:hypothetical protein
MSRKASQEKNVDCSSSTRNDTEEGQGASSSVDVVSLENNASVATKAQKPW